jgi:fido (protein-threonine AMPylation protein)
MYRGWPDIAGKFRQENLELKGTSLLPPHYTKINEKMFFLNRFIEDNLSKSDTLEKQINFTARVHHEITAIHPFRDGNGRVARIFANLVLRYFDLPYVLIPKVKAKQEMRDALRAADMGDFSKLNEMETSLLVDSFKTINMFYQKRVLKNSESGVSL